MKYYVTAGCYSLMGVVYATVRVQELSQEGSKSEVLEVSTTFPDRGRDDPRKYAIDALMLLAESL